MCLVLSQAFHRCMSLQQRMTASESPRFQAKCIKIGAVVTRSGADSTSPIVAILGWNFPKTNTWLNAVKYLKRRALIRSEYLQLLSTLSYG